MAPERKLDKDEHQLLRPSHRRLVWIGETAHGKFRAILRLPLELFLVPGDPSMFLGRIYDPATPIRQAPANPYTKMPTRTDVYRIATKVLPKHRLVQSILGYLDSLPLVVISQILPKAPPRIQLSPPSKNAPQP